MQKFNPNLYEILGRISRDATQEEIKQAYRTLAKLYHPDKNQNDKVASAEQMKELNEANEILSNKEKREAYNEELRVHDEGLRKLEEDRVRNVDAERRRRQTEIQSKKNRSQNQNAGSKLAAFVLVIVILGLLFSAFSKKE